MSEVYPPGVHNGRLHDVFFVARPILKQRCHPATDACSNIASRQRDLSLSAATRSSWLGIRRPTWAIRSTSFTRLAPFRDSGRQTLIVACSVFRIAISSTKHIKSAKSMHIRSRVLVLTSGSGTFTATAQLCNRTASWSDGNKN